MAEGAAFSFLGKLAERMVDPILRQFSYLFFCNGNIKNLEKELKRLQADRHGVELQVVAAEHNLETIDPAMQLWVEEANEIEKKAFIVIEQKATVEIMCLNLGCLNVKQRYLLSRNAIKLIDDIRKHKADGVKYAKSTHSAPPPGIVTGNALIPELPTRIASSQSEGFESRKSIVEQVMEALNDDKISMIGICGIGGVGKTTMANEVCRRAKAQGLFEQFAMTSVSQTQDFLKIQKEVAGMLGLNFKDEDTILLRAQQLRARLSKGRKILVILDDVWQEVPLQEVGIPTGCKVICTSRSKDVLRDMGTRIYDVEVLTDTESWNLFVANVGNSHVTAEADRYDTAKRIVKKCGGLPIAIVTLAKALKDKEKCEWDNALGHLEESTGEKIRGMPEHVYKCIQLSYEFVKDSGAGTLLLLCCLFPDDAIIGVGTLIIFKDLPTLEETEDGVRTLVNALISCNLLQIADEGEGLVKVHDVIRDVCLSIEGLNKLGQNRKPLIGTANRSIVLRKSEFFVDPVGGQQVKEIMEALADDQIWKIGMCGMKGAGKRTLMNKVIEKVKEKNLFDDVAMIVVPERRQDLVKMQSEVARKLGLGSLGISERAKEVRERLSDGRRRLIILYDVWGRIELEQVGIPVGCKVVIVSRIEERCEEMGCEKIVRFPCMSKEEGLVLFREHAGRFDEELDHIAKQIVWECSGYPMATILIGEALKNQDKKVWLDALDQFQDCDDFDVFFSTVVKFNCKGLSSCQAEMMLWLICIMEIRDKDTKMEMVVVTYLKLFKDDEKEKGDLQLEASRDKVIDILQELYNRFLLDIDVDQNTLRVPPNVWKVVISFY